ncbi:MAG: hypothetical protein AB8G26_04005 [Ilumatobacter sp.]
MNSATYTYRVEIRHTTHIDKIPVDELDAAIAEWQAKPWWQRLMRRSPLVRIGSLVTSEPEEIPGEYDDIDDADRAAQRHAASLDGAIRPDSTIAVVRSDGRRMGGWYPGDRGRC